MSLITAEQTAAYYANRGQVLGEDDTCGECCSHCEWLTPADELVVLDGQDVCRSCLYALTGDGPYAPDTSWAPSRTDPPSRDWQSPHRDWPTWAVLLGLLAGLVLFLGLLHAGQAALCHLHQDQPLRYCAGYSPTTAEETP